MRCTGITGRIGLTVLAGLFLATVAQAAPDDIKSVALPRAGYDFAINTQTSALAVVFPEQDEVALYPRIAPAGDPSGAVHAKVGRMPVGIVSKRLAGRSIFAVVCFEGREMTVLDGRSLAVIKSIPLSLDGPSSVAASGNPRDPYVYYCGGRGHDSKLGRVNAERLTDEGIVATGSESVMDAAVSADGSLLYLRGPWSPSGFQVWEAPQPDSDRRPPAARQIKREHRSCPGYLPDPNGQYVVSGQEVYPADLSKEVARLPLSPLLYSATRPVLVGVEDDLLVAVSANTFRTVGAVKLPGKLPAETKELPINNPRADFKRFAYAVRLPEAPKADCLVLCRQASVLVIPYAALHLKAEPFLAIQVEGSLEASVGRRQVIRVVPRDRSVKVELADGPRGLELQDHQLAWTPTEFQVGTHRVALSISGQGASRVQELTLAVHRPSVAVPFSVTHFQLSPDHTVAVLMGYDLNPTAGFHANQEQQRLALVDLQKIAIIARRTMPAGLRTAAVDGHYVYASPADSDAFYVLDRKDLSDRKRLYASGRVRDLVPVNDELLFIATESNKLTVLKVPSLEPAQPGEVGIGIHLSGPGESATPTPPQWLGTGWWYDGCLYDPAFKKLRVLVQPRSFWSAVLDSDRAEMMRRYDMNARSYRYGYAGPVPTWLLPWSASVSDSSLMHGKRLVGSLRSEESPFGQSQMAAAILPDQPAAVVLRQSQSAAYGQPSRERTELTFYDLLAASAGLRMMLLDQPVSPTAVPFGYAQMTRLEVRPGRLVGLSANRLYVVQTPKLDPEKYAAAMHPAIDASVRVLGADPLSVPLPSLAGATPPVETSLRQEVPGVEVDRKAGQLNLRRDLVAPKLVDMIWPMLAGNWPPNQQPADVRLRAYLEETRPLFERITGRKAKGVPVWLCVGLTARDRSLQSIDLTSGLFVDLPAEQLVTRAAGEALRSARRAAPAYRWAGSPDRLEQRVNQIERRIDQMDRKLDLLMQMLQEQRKGKEPPKK